VDSDSAVYKSVLNTYKNAKPFLATATEILDAMIASADSHQDYFFTSTQTLQNEVQFRLEMINLHFPKKS